MCFFVLFLLFLFFFALKKIFLMCYKNKKKVKMPTSDGKPVPTMLTMNIDTKNDLRTDQKIEQVEQLKRELQRQKAKANKASRKLSALSSVYSQVMNIDEQRDFLNKTSLPTAEKELLLKESQKWQDEAEALDKTLPTSKSDISLIEELNNKVAEGVKSQLRQFEKESSSERVGEGEQNVEAKQEYTYWARIRKMFVTAGKYSFKIIEWIIRHPLFAMWLTRVALLIKERICREISLRLGYKQGTTDLVTYLQESAKRYYQQSFEEFSLTTIYSFCNSGAFDWFASGIAGTLGTLFGAITGGVGALFVGFFTSSFAYAFKDTIRETILLSTSYFIIQKTGSNFMEIFTGECIKDPPKVWDNSWVSWFSNVTKTDTAKEADSTATVEKKVNEEKAQSQSWGLFSIFGVE